MCIHTYYACAISERIPKKLIALVAFERKVTWLGNKNEGTFFVKWYFWILNCDTTLSIESISQEESLTVSMLMHLTDSKNNRNNSTRVRGLLCHALSWLCGCPWTQGATLFSLHAIGRERVFYLSLQGVLAVGSPGLALCSRCTSLS